jgi:hypothetical protein
VVAVGLAAACGGSSPADTTESSSAAAAAASAPDAGMSYPAAYTAMSLPELEGATLTSTGRQQTSLRDGLALTLTSSKTVDEVNTFYRDALTALSWTAAPQGRGALVPNMPVAGGSFSKDGLTFTTIITAMPTGETRIEVRVLER